MTAFSGGCHCGNIALIFTTDVAPEELPMRECQCSFCRKHGVRTVTDPAGQVTIDVRDKELLSHYQFGHSVADFLVCRECGIYVAAYMKHDEGAVATLNINTLADNPFGARHGQSADYSAESASSRATRRRQMWTPARLISRA